MLTFKKNYFFLTVLLLIVEVCIALFVHDKFIRPYIGDLLVVMLIYCFLKTFWNAPVPTVALSVLVFACMIEALQYFHFVEVLGLEKNTFAKVILGNTFHWLDIAAYAAGILVILIVEKYRGFPFTKSDFQIRD